MTIITESGSSGTRRCDSRCHHASGTACGCVCGGRYHGAGKHAQARLTADLADLHRPAWMQAGHRVIRPALRQLALDF